MPERLAELVDDAVPRAAAHRHTPPSGCAVARWFGVANAHVAVGGLRQREPGMGLGAVSASAPVMTRAAR